MKPFLVFLFLIGLGSAFASDLNFILSNDTNRSFEGVYISAADDADWDGNILTRGRALAAGGKLDVRFESTASSPAWDLRIVDDEGLTVTFHAIKLEGDDKVTLKYVKGKVTVEVE
jgi:hypothetical protein